MMLRLIGIKFSQLIYGSYQADLFADSVKDLHLSAAMDSIRDRFGEKAVMRAISL
jgi:DNA polymerase-4